MSWLTRLAPGLLFIGLALLLQWPLSSDLRLLPADINSQHHIIVFNGLDAALFAPGCVEERPDLLAWPMWLLSSAASVLLPPAGAYRLACVLWLAAHGAAGWALGGALGWTRPRRWVVAVALECSALGLMFISTGRIEHLIQPWFALAAAGMLWPRPRTGLAMAALGLVLAAQSSPYQAVPGGILLLSLGVAQGWRSLARALLASALAAVPIVLLWSSSTTPHAPGQLFSLPLGVQELLWDPMPWGERLALLAPPAGVPLGTVFESEAPASEQFLGLVLGIGGLVGALSRWRAPLARAVLLCMAGCIVLSLGYTLRWSSTSQPVAWLPWGWLSLSSLFHEMTNTNRFLTGAVFAGAMGLGLLADRRRVVAAVICVLLVSESLLLSPSGWPVPAIRIADSALPSTSRPLLLWPPAKWLPNGVTDLIALETGQPPLILSGVACGRKPPSPAEGIEWGRQRGAQLLELKIELNNHRSAPPLPLPPGARPLAEGDESVLWPL